ncbi:hypothetical protein [Prochlorococcus sp. MIT 1307]|uniref:hypothetical protein n=1 Tax=Prochlorococcus sp. MIT 1307 TaxID=3096219 RepID=UPI002A7553E2|nr:hypothetical protein [Prochlorococcus sp. MIT 1307]
MAAAKPIALITTKSFTESIQRQLSSFSKFCFLAGLFLCPYTSPIAKETGFGITFKYSEQEGDVLIVIPISIMKLQSVALSVACICIASTGFGLSLLTPHRASASEIYADNLLSIGINPDSLGIGNALSLDKAGWL